MPKQSQVLFIKQYEKKFALKLEGVNDQEGDKLLYTFDDCSDVESGDTLVYDLVTSTSKKTGQSYTNVKRLQGAVPTVDVNADVQKPNETLTDAVNRVAPRPDDRQIDIATQSILQRVEASTTKMIDFETPKGRCKEIASMWQEIYTDEFKKTKNNLQENPTDKPQTDRPVTNEYDGIDIPTEITADEPF